MKSIYFLQARLTSVTFLKSFPHLADCGAVCRNFRSLRHLIWTRSKQFPVRLQTHVTLLQ